MSSTWKLKWTQYNAYSFYFLVNLLQLLSTGFKQTSAVDSQTANYLCHCTLDWRALAAGKTLNSTSSKTSNRLSAIQITHCGREAHICISKLIIIGSDNGLSPVRRQAIIWTNAGILLIGPLGTKFNEILIELHTFSFKRIHLKMSSGKWRPFCLGLKVIIAVRHHQYIGIRRPVSSPIIIKRCTYFFIIA